MKFLKKLNGLLNSYGNDCRKENSAVLYGINENSKPLAKHIVFSKMPPEIMTDMLQRFTQSFPKELLKIYKVTNGANLFFSVRLIGKRNIPIGFSNLSIYGIPLTYDRTQIEPYDIRIEDLNRPDSTPNAWLKFGSYSSPDNDDNLYWLFVDTTDGRVHSVARNQTKCMVDSTWKSIDHCLCELFDRLLSDT